MKERVKMEKMLTTIIFPFSHNVRENPVICKTFILLSSNVFNFDLCLILSFA